MRSFFLAALLASFLSPIAAQAQKDSPKDNQKEAQPASDIFVSGDVLKTAEWAVFKYMGTLEAAKTGNQKAVKDFLEFTSTLDGDEITQHAITCIELIPYMGDEKMGAVLYILKPKLRDILLTNFQLAQVRTKKEEMRKPMQEWAPLTWKGLHGEKVVCSSCMTQGLTKAAGAHQKPTPNTGANTDAVEPAGKQ